MREGLSQPRTYVATFGSQLENTTYLLSLKIAIEHHIARALDASHAVQRTLDISVDNIAEAQKGFLPPHVVTYSIVGHTNKQ